MTKDLRLALSLPAHIRNGISYHLAGFLFTPRPKFVCFPVTFRCDSRCQMCNIWQNPPDTPELSLEKIDEIFASRLFKNVEDVVLHGGEPFLRGDIHDIYKIIIKSFSKLKNIMLSTNGLNPKVIEARLQEILAVQRPKSLRLTLSISIDGMKSAHEAIRGVQGSFGLALETLQIMKRYQKKSPFQIEIITVIQPQNLNDLEAVKQLARENDVGINFQPLMIDAFYANSMSDQRLRFSEDQMLAYRRFIGSSLFSQNIARSLYWRNYLEMMEGGKRTLPCAYDRYVFSLYPTGEVLPCSREDWIRFGHVQEKSVDQIWFGQEAKNIRKKMRTLVCPTCDFYCGAEYSLKREFFTLLRYLMRDWRLSFLRRLSLHKMT
jgi:MoaA/NifB/PqqE/SkfB family radical SAM enzyme